MKNSNKLSQFGLKKLSFINELSIFGL